MARKFSTFEEFLIPHGGDVDKAARAAFVAVNATKDDNDTLTEEKRQLKLQLKEALETLENDKAKIPQEGTSVISKEESEMFIAYKALGNPNEISKSMEDMKKTVEASLITSKLLSFGISEKAIKLALLVLQSEKDVYFEEKEVKGVKTSEIDVVKLKKDYPNLFVEIDSDENDDVNENNGVDENDDAKDKQKSSVRVISSSSGKGKVKGNLSQVAVSYSKQRYKGPTKGG